MDKATDAADEFDEKEAVERRDALLLKLLRTPPQPRPKRQRGEDGNPTQPRGKRGRLSPQDRAPSGRRDDRDA